MMLDALRLTGDSTIADDLELATTNSIAGGQHPSGAWCTYDTPMNGRHVPSHLHISFQARPGAMFLNCCSVNGPRVFGMLGQWAVMRSGDGLAVNYHGPMRAKVTLADGTPVAIEEDTDYPVGGTIRLKISPSAERTFTLSLRIPAWSTKTDVSVNGKPASDVRPGEYSKFHRSWQPGDEIVLRLDMGLRYESGDLPQAGKASIYRGPILLCSDSRFNKPIAPTIDVAWLDKAKFVPSDEASVAKAAGTNKPWVVVDLPTTQGTTVRLIDFANAGATTVEGKTISEYASWLPAKSLRPPRPAALRPADGAKIGPGPMRFTWRRMISQPGDTRQYELSVAESPTFDRPILRVKGTSNGEILVPADQIRGLRQGTPYYWKLVANDQHGRAESIGPYKQFTIDPTAPQQVDRPDRFRPSDKMVTEAALRGDVKHGFPLVEP
jgi:hypothetical protein